MIEFSGELPITDSTQVSRGRDWQLMSQLARGGGVLAVEEVVGSELFDNVRDAGGAGRGLVEQAARRLAEQGPMAPSDADDFVARVLYYVDGAHVYMQPGFRPLQQ